VEIKTYIEDLFKYFETFESNYASFDTEAFFQTYNGIYAVFQAMRQQRNEAVDVDRFFLERIKMAPLTASDLRQVATQILITYFESEADIDGQSNRAYLYCRDLRPIKQDIAYFENHLVPLLFREGSLNNNYALSAFLLNETARYLNKFGKGFQPDLSPESFNALTDPMKFLELTRRRMILGENVLSDRGGLEFHLAAVDAFSKLAKKSKLYEYYLTRWNYLRQTTFWSRVKRGLGNFWGAFTGAFASNRYFRLSITQRRGAYAFYTIAILFFLFMAVFVPLKWHSYTVHQLEQFQQKAATVPVGTGR
jgi:hypothetical protein